MIAARSSSAVFRGVSPRSWMSDPAPRTTPLAGDVSAAVMPFARVTGIASLRGLMPATVRKWALYVPTVWSSRLASTAPISTSPSCVFGSMRPGYTCWPETSRTGRPSGVSTRPRGPTAAMRPSRTTTTPSSTGGPDTGWTVPPARTKSRPGAESAPAASGDASPGDGARPGSTVGNRFARSAASGQPSRATGSSVTEPRSRGGRSRTGSPRVSSSRSASNSTTPSTTVSSTRVEVSKGSPDSSTRSPSFPSSRVPTRSSIRSCSAG